MLATSYYEIASTIDFFDSSGEADKKRHEAAEIVVNTAILLMPAAMIFNGIDSFFIKRISKKSRWDKVFFSCRVRLSSSYRYLLCSTRYLSKRVHFLCNLGDRVAFLVLAFPCNQAPNRQA